MSSKQKNIKSDDVEFASRASYFPYQYLLGLLEFLYRNRDLIEIITYNDLPWGSDHDAKNFYNHEYNSWLTQLKNGKLNKNKTYILLQHDVDRLPERTMRVLEDEAKLDIPSNTMIFNKRVNRKHIRETGEMAYAKYDIDFKRYRELQNKQNFVFCYHCNAYEQALFDMEKAQNIFNQDINELRENLKINYFSPHGGVPCPEGKSNSSQEWVTKDNVRWVHNGRGVRFHGNYSDGGLNNRSRDPNQRDLRDFVRTWQPGKRYRILLHPQYYHSPYAPSEWLSTATWYRKMTEQCASSKAELIWENVELSFK